MPNKFTGEVKELILAALSKVGGADYLAARALDTPGPFMALVGKVLPLQVTGPNGTALVPKEVHHIHLSEPPKP